MNQGNWIGPPCGEEIQKLLIDLIILMERNKKMQYQIDDKMRKRLETDYSYHKPFGDQPERYAYIRANAFQLARVIVENTPPSREQSIALTLLEQVVMEANAAIARNEIED